MASSLELELGVSGLSLLPGIAQHPERWVTLESKIRDRLFLHSEGLSTALGAPHVASGELLRACREIVARFDHYYRDVVQHYYEQPASRSEYFVNPAFSSMLDADRETNTPFPLSRLDCVLTQDGQLRVIEINPVGGCVLHLRNSSYLAHLMSRHGLAEDAAQLQTLEDDLVGAFAQFHAQRGSMRKSRPSVGILCMRNMQRGSRVIWRRMFSRAGWSYVDGAASDVEVTATGVRLRGVPVDVLWGDHIFYLGYQYQRYKETKFPTKLGDYSKALDEANLLWADAVFRDLCQAGVVANVSPAKAYLAISKHLLSWIHRHDYPLPMDERRWLSEHVARTYGATDRTRGVLPQTRAIKERERLLLKPCQYGGAHGVQLGCETTAEAWERDLEKIWDDPSWVVQEYYRPCQTPSGQFLSLGLYNYGGKLGGITIRTAPSLVISARRSSFIPVVLADRA